MTESFNALHEFIETHNNLRICILDNNNIQFCMHNQRFFPIDKIYEHYDIVLIPGWVHAEVGQSDRRLQYIEELTKPLFILDEVTDYLPFVNYQDERLINVFFNASPPSSKPRRYLRTLISKIKENKARILRGEDIAIEDVIENWMENYYSDGFDTKETASGDLKKNAGEISILTLAYLLIHKYKDKIKHIAISSSDKGVLEIKKNIMDNVSTDNLLDVPFTNPIGFLSTDVLLASAHKLGIINDRDVRHLRKNKKFVICTISNNDGTNHLIESVLETEEYLSILNAQNTYGILF